MALTDTDRRRLAVATAVTLVALPALWWANTASDSASPNLAAVGVEVESSNQPAPEGATTALGSAKPLFLDGPTVTGTSDPAVIAVPARPTVEGFTASATFRNTMPSDQTCVVPGLAGGTSVTVVNRDNNRSITCTTITNTIGADKVVLATGAFAVLADLTDAPIAVEIRQ